MKIAVLRETADAENRVAATPETVRKLIGLGAELAIEAGAGAGAAIADAAYAEAGATVAAAKVYGASESQHLEALGLTLPQIGGTWASPRITGLEIDKLLLAIVGDQAKGLVEKGTAALGDKAQEQVGAVLGDEAAAALGALFGDKEKDKDKKKKNKKK